MATACNLPIVTVTVIVCFAVSVYRYGASYCVAMRAGPVMGCVAPWLAFLRSLGAEQQPQQTPVFRTCAHRSAFRTGQHSGQVSIQNWSAFRTGQQECPGQQSNIVTRAAFCSHDACHHDCNAATLLDSVLIPCSQIVLSRWIQLAASIAVNFLVFQLHGGHAWDCVSLRPSYW